MFIATVMLGMADLPPVARYALGAILLAVYASYAVVILRLRRAAETEVEHGLHLELLLGGNPFDPRGWATVMQVLIGVVAILIGAYVFVDQIVFLSQHANLSPGVLSLILSPLATELPEKYNAVVWIRQSKDNLALANITGAMVFQSCIPVALGLVFTPWHLTSAELLGGAIAVFSAALLYVNLRDGELGTPTLIVGGVAYAVFHRGPGMARRSLAAPGHPLRPRPPTTTKGSRDLVICTVRAPQFPLGNRDEQLPGDLPAVLRQPAALR